MTGFAAIPLAEEGGSEHSNAQLAGVAKVLGPRWLQSPALTIGLLGVQMFWSIEMSYGESSATSGIRSKRVNILTQGTPYLISLVLSRPHQITDSELDALPSRT